MNQENTQKSRVSDGEEKAAKPCSFPFTAGRPLPRKSSAHHLGAVPCVLQKPRGWEWACDSCLVARGWDQVTSIPTPTWTYWRKIRCQRKSFFSHWPFPFTQFPPSNSPIICMSLDGLPCGPAPWASIKVLASTSNYGYLASKQEDEMIEE